MKKLLFVTLFILAPLFTIYAQAEPEDDDEEAVTAETPLRGKIMAYCSVEDLNAVYGKTRISAWGRMDPDAATRAIRNAGAEIDGYLISGGYSVPIAGPPENLKKYCIDIAAANLILSAGVLANDTGGEAIINEAKNARQFLSRVAEGKYKIPGYAEGDESGSSPPGGVKVASGPRLDLSRF
jgi:phage gp36-like protein